MNLAAFALIGLLMLYPVQSFAALPLDDMFSELDDMLSTMLAAIASLAAIMVVPIAGAWAIRKVMAMFGR